VVAGVSFRDAIRRYPASELPSLVVNQATNHHTPTDDEFKRSSIEAHANNLVTSANALISQRIHWESEVCNVVGQVPSVIVQLTVYLRHCTHTHMYTQIQQRTYFHYVPLKPIELQTWHAYLDFEESQANMQERARYLYERCLIVCVCCRIRHCPPQTTYH
jgi:hypothetical protein